MNNPTEADKRVRELMAVADKWGQRSKRITRVVDRLLWPMSLTGKIVVTTALLLAFSLLNNFSPAVARSAMIILSIISGVIIAILLFCSWREQRAWAKTASIPRVISDDEEFETRLRHGQFYGHGLGL